VAAGGNHSQYVTDDGNLWAMGANANGELGDRTIINRSTPVLIASGLLAGPAITKQPAKQSVAAGKGATFSVAANGWGLTYEWQKDGVTIPDATGSMFTIAKTQETDAGNYRVIVSNGAGSITSADAALTVKPSGSDENSGGGGGGGAPGLFWFGAIAALLTLRGRRLIR